MNTDKSNKKPGTVKTGPRQHSLPQPKTGQTHAETGKPGFKAPGSGK